jgi:phosphoglucosamine mutase
MKKLFGTDGIRGKANVYPITPEVALAVGQAIAKYFLDEKSTHRIVIGKDTRRSSYMIELAIASGICSMGSEAVLLGPMPTPGVAYLTRSMRADAGIMISASHNPYYDNGIKFFDKQGYKLSDEVELQIEKMVEDGIPEAEKPVDDKIGRAFRINGVLGRYVEFVKRSLPKDIRLDGLKVVVDCSNGAAYKIAPIVLWELGAEVIEYAVQPDGININKDCGALYPETMSKAVKKFNADIGIGLDGDADRLILCDENGEVVDGDYVITLCAQQLLENKELTNNKVVGTIMTNMGIENYLAKLGIELSRTKVGDRYVIEEMLKQNAVIGGEPSGHIIFSQFNTTGDGLVSALQVLSVMIQKNKKLSELIKGIPLYPQVNKSLRVSDKKPIEELPELNQAIRDLNTKLGKKGRSVIRYSGTESVLRMMVEGEDEVLITSEIEKLVQVAEACLC